MSWLLTWRAIASIDDPRHAAADAIDVARFADRAGSPLALLCALDALIAPCARLGLTDECRRVAAHVADNAELLAATVTSAYMADVRAEALASLPPDAASPAPPADRKELFDLLARIERAVA